MKKKVIYIALAMFLGFSSQAYSYCIADFEYEEQLAGVVQFYNFSYSHNEGPVHYYWDFGDGNASYEENPINIYITSGIYNVSLSIITGDLCYDTYTLDVYIGIDFPSPFCLLDIDFETFNATSPDYNDGSANVYIISDIPNEFYAYWDNGAEGFELDNLEPGTYCVTVTDHYDCHASSCVTIGYNNNCNASFFIDSLSFSHTEGAYIFINNSHGEQDFYEWNFGDGTYAYGTNPIHVYEESGVYQVCLTIYTHYNCVSEYCKEVNIINTIPVSANLHGYVNAGESVLPQGIAVLYQYDNIDFIAVDYKIIEDGYYVFENLSNDYLYLTHLIPSFDINEIYFPKYIATYSGNCINWETASFIDLHIDTISTCQLVSNNEIYYHSGLINGYVNFDQFSAYETEIFHISWIDAITPIANKASNIVVILEDIDHKPIDFSLTNGFGKYEFKNLEYGGYYLSVEKAGLASENIYIEINEEQPQSLANNFTIASNSISNNVHEEGMAIIKVYPNPCNAYFILKNLPEGEKNIEFCNSDGKIMQKIITKSTNLHIDITGYKTGIYAVVIRDKKSVVTKKVIKM